MAPWWALVVGLISGLVFLCLSVVSIALCCNCVRKKTQDKQKLKDPETASNNNEKAYINHAIVHDEYAVPVKRTSTPEDEATPVEGEIQEGQDDDEADSPKVPPKMENLDEQKKTPGNDVNHKKQNGVRWKETPEIIGGGNESDEEERDNEQNTIYEEENQPQEADHEDTDQTEHHNEHQIENNDDSEEDEQHEANDAEDDHEEEHEDADNNDNDDNGDNGDEDDDGDEDGIDHAQPVAGGIVSSVVPSNLEPRKVSLIRLVREGVYGAIYKGEIERDGKDIQALIKTFPDNAPYTEEQKTEFLREGTKFQPLDHKHLLSPYGVTEKRDMPLVVYPEANLLDLKSYIVDPHHVLSVRHMLDFSLNMADAMAYLHQHDIVHKDLAARNCWLTDALVIRICDGALSSELFPEDYEKTREITQPMPIRWMAPECLLAAGNFTKFSDVWAYGILIWELFKRGQHRPYWELTTQKVYNNVIDGDVLIKPFFAPDNVYELIRSCWNKNEEERPTFDEIVKKFQNEINKRTSGRRVSTALS